jgi:hypothetical protein
MRNKILIPPLLLSLVINASVMVHAPAARSAVAAETSVTLNPVAAPQGFAILDTGHVVTKAIPGGYYPYDSATSPNANWNIVAWTNPAGEAYLAPFIDLPSYGANGAITAQTWEAVNTPTATQNLALIISQNLQTGISSQTLMQNGIEGVKGCTTAGGTPQEYDFFVGGNATKTNPYYPSAYLADQPNPPLNPALSHVTGIDVKGAVTLIAQGPTAVPGQCPVNQSSLLYAVIFNNLSKHQTLFYQLDLNSLCYAGTDASRNAWCKSYVPAANYFSIGQNNVWGIDDPLTSYVNPATNQPFPLLQTPGTLTLNLNLLPRIAHLIQTGQYGMDTNLADWQWGSFYYGQHSWGSSALVSTWSSVNFGPSIVYSPGTPN